eukprot:4296693-Pyramimonas_sp.AAC.1
MQSLIDPRLDSPGSVDPRVASGPCWVSGGLWLGIARTRARSKRARGMDVRRWRAEPPPLLIIPPPSPHLPARALTGLAALE